MRNPNPFITLSEYKTLTLPSSSNRRAVLSLESKGLIVITRRYTIRAGAGLMNYKTMYDYKTTKLGREVLEEIRETEAMKTRLERLRLNPHA